jgi:hypothetical protein
MDATTTRCQRCGRKLTSATSRLRGYGPGCVRKLRAAARRVDVQLYSQRQLDAATEAIELHGVIPSTVPGIWLVVGTWGEIHATDPSTARCTCTAGQHGRRCYHIAAAFILEAA